MNDARDRRRGRREPPSFYKETSSSQDRKRANRKSSSRISRVPERSVNTRRRLPRAGRRQLRTRAADTARASRDTRTAHSRSRGSHRRSKVRRERRAMPPGRRERRATGRYSFDSLVAEYLRRGSTTPPRRARTTRRARRGGSSRRAIVPGTVSAFVAARRRVLRDVDGASTRARGRSSGVAAALGSVRPSVRPRFPFLASIDGSRTAARRARGASSPPRARRAAVDPLPAPSLTRPPRSRPPPDPPVPTGEGVADQTPAGSDRSPGAVDRSIAMTTAPPSAPASPPTPSSGSPGPSRPAPSVIGNEFVNQYYAVLHATPELLYRFYNEGSSLTIAGVGCASCNALSPSLHSCAVTGVVFFFLFAIPPRHPRPFAPSIRPSIATHDDSIPLPFRRSIDAQASRALGHGADAARHQRRHRRARVRQRQG